MKCNDRVHRYENNLHMREIQSEKLKTEKETIEKEMVILQEEEERMKVSLETLQESIPQTQSGVCFKELDSQQIVLSIEQKEEYNQLKQVYLQEAGELIQMNEIKKREEETLVSQIKQKNETLQNYLSEETNTKVIQNNRYNTQKMIEDLKGQSNRLHSTYQEVNRVIQSLEQESESLQNEYSTSYQLLQEVFI